MLMEQFTAEPTASIQDAFESWSETCMAYRFLGNSQVEWRENGPTHCGQTQTHMQAHPIVLCIQDMTELDFNGQEM